MQDRNETGIIKRILKNEIAESIAIIGGVWVFVQLIILPLNNVINKVDYMEKNHLAHIEANIVQLQQDMKLNTADHTEIKERLGEILGELKGLK